MPATLAEYVSGPLPIDEYIVEAAIGLRADGCAALVESLPLMKAATFQRDGTGWLRVHVLAGCQDEAEDYVRWRLSRVAPAGRRSPNLRATLASQWSQQDTPGATRLTA
jgi:hypothetical protein